VSSATQPYELKAERSRVAGVVWPAWRWTFSLEVGSVWRGRATISGQDDRRIEINRW